MKIRNRPLYAYDAEADAVQRWHGVSSQVAEELLKGEVTPLFQAKDVRMSNGVGAVPGSG